MRELPARYQPIDHIAVGGMGEVIRVHDRLLMSTVAMKLALPHVMAEPVLRRRFSDEARLTAQLHHPGIIAVHDLGALPDGTLYFTMEEVRGRTLADAELALPDALAALVLAARALGYAHEQGVVHRDVKPENVMVAAHGEVRVMDWGLARRLEEAEGLAVGSGPEDGEGRTTIGQVVGTVSWMPPEQARGEHDALGPEADVYALGALLYRLLTGRPPYQGPGALRELLDGPPPPILDGAPGLVALVEAAMDRTPWRRPLTGSRFADRLQAWIDEDRAMDQVRAAILLAPEIAARGARAAEIERHLDTLEEVPPHAPVEEKIPRWQAEDEAGRLRRDARLLEVEYVQRLRSALNGAPELAEAHRLLAAFHQQRLVLAERRGDADAALEHETLLRAHDRGEHRAWLEGNARFALRTDPPARVEWSRLVLRDRRLVEEPAGDLGDTPLTDVALPRGSHLLRLTAPGCVPVRMPVFVDRDGSSADPYPGATEAITHRLPRIDEVGPDDLYVPAGWFQAFGDSDAADPRPPRRVWVDAFFLQRFPVTVGRWAAFLQDHGDPEPDLVPERWGEARADVPVTGVSWWAARAFATWEAERSGLPWRLPHDLEWEKAARGVDGRHTPWGHQLEPRWARVATSEAGPAEIASIYDYPLDEGPYGVRGQAGNVRDWCGNPYVRRGIDGDRVVVDPTWRPAPTDFVMMRGGAFTTAVRQIRVASRVADPPHQTYRTLGLRLCRSAPS
jgi:serine/threonine-protein kinase